MRVPNASSLDAGPADSSWKPRGEYGDTPLISVPDGGDRPRRVRSVGTFKSEPEDSVEFFFRTLVYLIERQPRRGLRMLAQQRVQDALH